MQEHLYRVGIDLWNSISRLLWNQFDQEVCTVEPPVVLISKIAYVKLTGFIQELLTATFIFMQEDQTDVLHFESSVHEIIPVTTFICYILKLQISLWNALRFESSDLIVPFARQLYTSFVP